MENLFNNLGASRPTKEVRVKMIKRNLLPDLQTQLTFCSLDSFANLLRLYKAIEETMVRTQKFVPPPTNYRQLLESGMVYHKPAVSAFDYTSHSSAISVKENFAVAAIATPSRCST